MALELTTANGHKIRTRLAYPGTSKVLEITGPDGDSDPLELDIMLSESDVDALIYMLRK